MPIDSVKIQEARSVQLTDALDVLGLRWKEDCTFKPRVNSRTRLVFVDDRYEITITAHLFILRRRGCRDVIASGGGAIDLVMALTGVTFRAAVRELTKQNDDAVE